MHDNGTPDWLAVEKGGGGDEQAAGKESVEIGSTLATSNEEEGARHGINNDATQQKQHPDNKRPQQRCGVTTISISIIIFALFVYATAVQGNDPDKHVWSFYYGLLAVIPALFVVNSCCRGKIESVKSAIYGLAFAMSIWSIVFIVMISLDLKKADEAMREELIFEISGASIGFVAALYHAILTWRMHK